MKVLATANMALLSTVLLVACGGDSDSSGDNNTATFGSVLGNGNEYSCPSKEALDSCNTDANCTIAKCTITKEVVKPVDPNTTKECDVEDKTVTGIRDESCKFVADDADVIITCASGTMTLDGKLGNLNSNGGTFSSGSNLYGYKVQCP